MRDTATDYTTGWLRNGLYEREYDPLADGSFGGLGELGQVARKLPALGQQYLKEALSDPTTRDDAKKLLRAGGDALAEQAQKDAVEFANPTGKHKIVFKSFARQMGRKIVAAEEAILDAMPYKNTEDGRDALELARMADDPQQALATYFSAIALDSMSPDSDVWGEESEGLFGDDDEDEAMSRLEPYGMGMSKKGKKILKGVAIGVAVAAGAVLTGGVLLPAMGAALPAVLGTVGSVAGAVFKPKGGGGAAPAEGGGITVVQQQSPEMAPGGAPAAPVQLEAVQGIPPQVQQQLTQMPPEQAYQQAYQTAIQSGAGDQEAGQIAETIREQSEVVHGKRPASGVAQAGMFGMDTTTMALLGLGVFAISQFGGGGGSRRRRNPGRNRRRNPYAMVGRTGRGKPIWRYYCSSCGKKFRVRERLIAHLERSNKCFVALPPGALTN